MLSIPILLDRRNTNMLRGIAAVGIFVFHGLLGLDISPVFNLWGGMFVAIFLILSGYGINESYRQHGLKEYWTKRWGGVWLPTLLMLCAYNLLSPEGSLRRAVLEATFIEPTYWFVFCVTGWYVVYWLSRRWLGRWFWMPLALFALWSLNVKTSALHLAAEQALCFPLGVWISCRRKRLEGLSGRQLTGIALLCFAIGLFFGGLKMIPAIHAYKGTVAYHYLQMPFRLTWGISFAILLTAMRRWTDCRAVQWAGRHSLEIYIAHIPFIGLIEDVPTLLLVLGLSAIALLLLLLHRHVVGTRMNAAGYLFVLINSLFVAKYGARLFPTLYPYITAASAIGMAGFCAYLRPWAERHGGRLRWTVAGCVLLVAWLMGLQYAIDPYAIQVDRWSALHFPIRNLLHGEYPYAAQTHLGGYASPFPVWQVVHIPFYLLGNVGLSLGAGLALLFACLYRWGKKTMNEDFATKALTMSLLLLALSPSLWYEAAVRSDLLTNFLLTAAILLWMCSGRLSREWLRRHSTPVAIGVGLLASTRINVLIPLGVVLLPYFLQIGWRRQFRMVAMFAIVFTLTFALMAVWDWELFFHSPYSPYTLQTRQGHVSDLLLLFPLGIGLALGWTGGKASTPSAGDLSRAFLGTAILLVALVAVTFVHNMWASGNWDIFSSSYDITYFDTALPFCILSLLESEKLKIKS